MVIQDIEYDNEVWHGKIKLNLWNAYFEGVQYIELNIGGDSYVEKIEKKHEVTYKYIIDNQKEILKIILNELLNRYSEMQEEYGFEDEDLQECMPNVLGVEDFKDILAPKRIYILNVENDGITYVGYHFTCSWDEEHDFGVMMYKNRVVSMGGADCAFLSWVAEEDKESGIE